MQAHIILDIHTLTQYNLSMHSALAVWFHNLCNSWINSSGAEFQSSSSDDDIPGLEPITPLHSQYITNNQFLAFLDGYPMPTTIDANVSPVHVFASEPCTSWSYTQSQSAPFAVQDIADAYHHVHIDVDHADTHSPVDSNPPPPYDSALWDPGYSTDDSRPLLVDDSSTDGYDSSSSEESIPAHARYDADSDIDV